MKKPDSGPRASLKRALFHTPASACGACKRCLHAMPATACGACKRCLHACKRMRRLQAHAAPLWFTEQDQDSLATTRMPVFPCACALAKTPIIFTCMYTSSCTCTHEHVQGGARAHTHIHTQACVHAHKPMRTHPFFSCTRTVATPCCPAPVSAMMRCLPMRLASRAWPRELLILWAPVWLRSSRFR